MTERYADVVDGLRRSYDGAVEERSSNTPQPWKVRERDRYLALLREEGRQTLLEVGAGTGVHGRFFADAGLDVVCTDLSPAMVAHMRASGLEAHVCDFLSIPSLGRTFDAALAFNCLLHVPRADLPAALASISSAVVPGGLLYVGQYGGVEQAGPLPDDAYDPPRYFSWLTNDDLLAVLSALFEVVSFDAVDAGGPDDDVHFQASILRTR